MPETVGTSKPRASRRLSSADSHRAHSTAPPDAAPHSRQPDAGRSADSGGRAPGQWRAPRRGAAPSRRAARQSAASSSCSHGLSTPLVAKGTTLSTRRTPAPALHHPRAGLERRERGIEPSGGDDGQSDDDGGSNRHVDTSLVVASLPFGFAPLNRPETAHAPPLRWFTRWLHSDIPGQYRIRSVTCERRAADCASAMRPAGHRAARLASVRLGAGSPPRLRHSRAKRRTDSTARDTSSRSGTAHAHSACSLPHIAPPTVAGRNRHERRALIFDGCAHGRHVAGSEHRPATRFQPEGASRAIPGRESPPRRRTRGHA